MGLFVIAIETLWNKMPDQKKRRRKRGEQERGKKFKSPLSIHFCNFSIKKILRLQHIHILNRLIASDSETI